MDKLVKILQQIPRTTNPPAIPPEIKKAFREATSGLANIQQTIKEQQIALEQNLKLDNEYARKMEFYEKLHNQAEDIGESDRSK